MGRQRLVCGICKSVVLGTAESPRFIDGVTVPDRALICGTCAPAWHLFRLDLSASDAASAALAHKKLTIRGAVVADLHAKVASMSDHEAERMAALGVDIVALAADIDEKNVEIEPPKPLPRWPL